MRRQRSVPSSPSCYREIIKTVRLDEEEVKKDNREKRRAAHQGKLPIVHESDEHENAPAVNPQVKKLETCALKLGEAYRRKKKVVVAKTFQRSKSESYKRVMFDESKNIIRRIETEKYEPPESIEEKDGYANMSNEEINTRVEEFIQRFKKQIRLPGEVYSKK
ncbi:hypothetical protein NC651_010546 [Populus alba x Populus x berolinensis]|nr:hypothetical protein NC651_010546 [Populus alba x Populus x berolinensis]